MKRLLVFMLVLCLVFMTAGCSGGTNTNGDDSENGAPANDIDDSTDDSSDESVALNTFYEIEEIQDLVKSFQELEYSFSDADNVLKVDYKYIGQDTVEGSNADHFSIAFTQDSEKTEVEIWMDNSGTILKASFDGEVMGPAEAPMAGMFVMVVLVPFSMYAAEWEDAFLDNGYEDFGWAMSNKSQESRNFGAGNSTVHQYLFVVKDAISGSDLSYKFEVAEISGKSLFVGWEVEVGKENTSTFKVDKVVTK